MTGEGFDRKYPLIADALAAGLEDQLAEVYMLIGALRVLTRWPSNVLEARVGCDAGRLRESDSDEQRRRAVKHSIDYLSWVVALAEEVDLVSDRRQVVIGAYELSIKARGQLEERVDRCREAFECSVDGSYSALSLLRLGEVGQAWASAALHLEGSAAQRRATRVASMLEPITRRMPSPHISAARRELMTEADAAELLGVNVYREMRIHVALCETCGGRSVRAVRAA